MQRHSRVSDRRARADEYQVKHLLEKRATPRIPYRHSHSRQATQAPALVGRLKTPSCPERISYSCKKPRFCASDTDSPSIFAERETVTEYIGMLERRCEIGG